MSSSAVDTGGFQVTSNEETPEAIKANFATEPEPEALNVRPATISRPARPIPPESKPVERTRNPDGTFQGEDADLKPRAAKGEDIAEDAEEVETSEDAEKKHLGKPRHDPRARMLQATRQAAEVKRELAAERAEKHGQHLVFEGRLARLAAELEELRKPPAVATRPATPQLTADGGSDPEPQEEAFENYRDYVRAAARWEARQVFAASQRAAQERERQARIEAARDERTGGFRETIQAYAKTDPTFQERVSPEIVELVPLSSLPPGEKATVYNAIAEEIISSADAPRLMLYLSEHDDEYQRLATLSPRELVREFARIETRLEAASTGTAPRSVSQAKPPVRTVTGSPHVAETGLDEDTPFDEYLRRANAKEKRALPRR